MEIYDVHCPEEGCPVRMVWSPVAPEERDACRPAELDLVCLDADRCMGPICSLFSVSAARMKDRLKEFDDPRPW